MEATGDITDTVFIKTWDYLKMHQRVIGIYNANTNTLTMVYPYFNKTAKAVDTLYKHIRRYDKNYNHDPKNKQILVSVNYSV